MRSAVSCRLAHCRTQRRAALVVVIMRLFWHLVFEQRSAVLIVRLANLLRPRLGPGVEPTAEVLLSLATAEELNQLGYVGPEVMEVPGATLAEAYTGCNIACAYTCRGRDRLQHCLRDASHAQTTLKTKNKNKHL